MDGCIHQAGAVVVWNNLQAARDHVFAIDFGDPLLDFADDLFCVTASDHHDNAAYGFGVSAFDHCAVADFFADADVGHVPHIDRRACIFLQHDIADIVHAANQADAANQILLG